MNDLGPALLELEVPEHRPGFFDELRDGLGGRSPARVARPRLLLVAAVAAVVAGALAFSLTRGSDVASAAQVRAAVERALASTGSISGVFVNNESGDPDAAGVRSRFTASSTGAFRLDGLTFASVKAYDPATNVESISDDDGSLFVRITGLAPGPPDSAPANLVAYARGLGSVVAALAAASDPKVEEVTYDGRPAWLFSAPTGNEGEQRRVTVDRETGVPVRNDLIRDGKISSGWRIEGLRVSPTVTAIAPLEPRPGQDTTTYDVGFRRVSPSEARSLAEYTPLVPQHLPSGFTLSAVAYAASSHATFEEDGGNPPSLDVVSFAYRRGFDEIVVTTRRTDSSPGTSAADWQDPLHVSTAPASEPAQITFTGGELAGQTGKLVIEPDELPHIWTAGPELVVTVAGTIDRDELLQVANSLQAAGR